MPRAKPVDLDDAGSLRRTRRLVSFRKNEWKRALRWLLEEARELAIRGEATEGDPLNLDAVLHLARRLQRHGRRGEDLVKDVAVLSGAPEAEMRQLCAKLEAAQAELELLAAKLWGAPIKHFPAWHSPYGRPAAAEKELEGLLAKPRAREWWK